MSDSHDPVFQQVTPAQFAEARQHVDWLWQGYLAKGGITLLTSRWKAGKTTLVSVLVAKMDRGGQLGGLPVTPGKAAVVSDERMENWSLRHDRLKFAGNLVLLCRPLAARSSSDTWRALIEHLARLRAEQGVELAVIDSLGSFLPHTAENQALAMQDALRPLEWLAACGMAVLLVHHPRKKPAAAGHTSRGGEALIGGVDVLIEMKLPPATQPQDRRRQLLAWSRYPQTPRERVIELVHDGRDYIEGRPDAPLGRSSEYLALAEQLLATAPTGLTRRQLLDTWPAGHPAPHPALLWRVLDAAVHHGQLTQTGTGRRGDPFCYYCLPRVGEPGSQA